MDPSQLIYQTRKLVIVRMVRVISSGFTPSGRKLCVEGTDCKHSREERSVCPVVDEHKAWLSKKNSRADLKISMNEDNHLLCQVLGFRKK